MNMSQWLFLVIVLVLVSFIAGAIGAYFETRKRPKNDNNDDDES